MQIKRLFLSLSLGIGMALIVTIILAAIPLNCARAATLTVTNANDNGSGSLRQAIAGASPGDTITFDLTYPATITLTSGELSINKDLIIDGPGAEQLAIRGSNTFGVFYVSGGTVTISGLAVIGGYATYGGGLHITGSSTVMTLTDVVIANNSASSSGGGIYIERGSVTLNGGEIRDNSAGGSSFGTGGGGVYVEQSDAAFTQTGVSTITHNGAACGGGIYVYNGSTILNGGQIVTNTAGGTLTWQGGGGVYVYNGSVTISGGQVVSNAADYGGGIYLYDGGATLNSGQISGNRARDGGGVYARYGGAVFTQTGSSVVARNTTQTGGGVFIDEGSAVLNGGQILDNTANDGGGVLIRLGSVVLNGGQILSNTAVWNGGGIYINDSGATFTQTGSGSIAYNNAYEGGGIYIYAGSATLNSGEITRNSASNDGGGVYVNSADATLSIEGGQIALNVASAGDGSALYNNDGAINQTNAVTITGDIYQANGTFNGGSAPLVVQGSLSLAGGIFIAPSGGFQLSGSFSHTGGAYRQTQSVAGTNDIGFPKAGGVIINANNQNLDSTTVVIRAGVGCTTTSDETVRHCYDIAPTQTSNVSATITFYFNNSEVTSGNTCDTLNVYRWNGSGWIALTLDTTYGTNGRDCSSTPWSIRVKDVSEFSPFVLKSGDTPTAVTTASFTAAPQENVILHNAPSTLPAVGLAASLVGAALLRRARRRRR